MEKTEILHYDDGRISVIMYVKCFVNVSHSVIADSFATLWTVACQGSVGAFPRQGYWSGLSFPSPGDLLDPGVKPMSPTLQVDSLLSEPLGKSWTTRDISPCQPLDAQSPFPVCKPLI